MNNLFERHASIAGKRMKKKKSPFIHKAYSKKPKHRFLRQRKTKELIFQRMGLGAIIIAALFLVSLLWNVISNGATAFYEAQIHLPVTLDQELVDQESYRKMILNSLLEQFPEAQSREEKRDLLTLMSRNAPYALKDFVQANPDKIGSKHEVWLATSSAVSVFMKHRLYKQVDRGGKVNARQAKWIMEMAHSGQLRLKFNAAFFTKGDSREAEDAGVLASTIGSFLTILVCILIALPLGIATALYLEEFAPKNWFTDIIEININNLAAVPSIIFGLLGLSVYLGIFGLPRSSSLVGGMVLALLILPVIVIATRNALRAVPSSVRFAAMALGATPVQVAFHHTFIYALPGIMTGIIISIARALGETAPLLMIGMVAFIVDVPHSFVDPATTLPVQVYLWANNPELGFVEKTAAAIMVLLGFMIIINLAAVYVRKKFEIKWQ